MNTHRSIITLQLARAILFAAASLAATLTAQAQFTFTYTGTATVTAGGYTNGQAVSFTFTLAESSSPSVLYEAGGKVPMLMRWTQAGLWSSVTGTGLTGTVGAGSGRFDVTNDGSSVYGRLSTTLDAPTGLTANGNTVTQLRFEGIGWTGLSIPVVGASVADPEMYLIDQITPGTYAFNNKDGGSAYLTLGPVYTSVPFSFSSVTIANASAVPEPSTYAALAGILVLGATVTWRRRGKKVAAV